MKKKNSSVEVSNKHYAPTSKFEILQIEDSEGQLRKFNNKFTKTKSVSAIHGKNAIDVTVLPVSTRDDDVIEAYDPYRTEKLITDEMKMEKYGTLYHEFHGVEESSLYTEPQKSKNSDSVMEEEISFSYPGVTDTYEVPVQSSISNIEVSQVNIPVENNTNQVPFSEITFNKIQTTYDEPQTNQTLPPFIKPVVVKGIESESSSYQQQESQYYHEPTIVNSVPPTPIVADIDINIEIETKKEYQEVRNREYIYPTLDLFNKHQSEDLVIPDFIENNKEIINTTLKDFLVDAEVCNFTYGPTVTRYEIKLSSGVNVKKIVGLQENIKMALSAKTIRIEAPIPGKPNVGIEVPNLKARTVHFIDIVKTEEFMASDKPLLIALGLDIDGKPVYTNIAKMPHGLVGGGTGSGKSVCINTLLLSLLLKNSPDDLRLILIDPKRVELISYDDIPHLITPVINDAKMASESLKWAVDEMERRYNAFSTLRVRDIDGYNTKVAREPSLEKMSYIVIVIDELADLMMVCGSDVEDSIQRITQKARAAGIHLIVATQRPTTDVVKGTIKANIPTRIAFRVSQFVDSTTILDGGGAENLLGKGDMLLKEVEELVRIQGAYVDGSEIDRITDFIREYNEPNYLFTHEDLQVKQRNGNSSTENDELLYSAGIFFIENKTCSINSLQRHFNFGFSRAQKVVEDLEKMKIVGAKTGTTSREVLVTMDELDAIFRLR